jgi:hypothetical protein
VYGTPGDERRRKKLGGITVFLILNGKDKSKQELNRQKECH